MTTMATFRRKLGKPDFERMNLPEAYWRVRIQGVAEEVRRAVARYMLKLPEMMEQGAGLLVLGERGVGKTGIAALVLKEARSRGYTGFFSTVWEMREMIRSRVQFDDEMSMLQRAREVDVLVLDDLRPDDIDEKWFGRSEIEALVASRAAKQKITILTSRLTPRDLRERLPGLMDSAQACMVTLPVSGPNLREERKEELRRAVFGD